MSKINHTLLVLSGKGGVGKSTVSTQLALTLQQKKFKVGILDIDLCGPSVPYLLNVEDKKVHQSSDGWVPVYTDDDKSLAVMSIGFLLKSRDNAVVWRGPKKTATIKDFMAVVNWDHLDYLIIDAPPGTSDEHITIMEELKKIEFNTPGDGAIIVTSPQEVSIEDVRKEITFCRKVGIPIVGIVENMSGFVCPHCTECTNIFGNGGGAALAEHVKIPFLGTLPIDPKIGSLLGKSCIVEFPDSPYSQAFNKIVDTIVNNNGHDVNES